MGRPKRSVKVKKKTDEDDVRIEQADPESEDFFFDEVDKFHNQKEKIMLKPVNSDDDSEEEIEEVLGLDVQDSDDDEDEDKDDDMDNEDQSEEEKEGLPSEKAWGNKKSMYYDTDYVEDNAVSGSEEEDIEEEEEKEALALQKRLASALDDEDFDTQDFDLVQKDTNKELKKSSTKDKEHVIRDLSQLSKEEKLEILIKDSPELLELLDEFKDKLSEVIHKLQPLVQMARSGKISSQKGVKYLEIKNQLLLSYCVNIGFYLLLKSRQIPAKDHPVIGRLVQFRTLIKKLEPLDEQLQPEIEQLLTEYRQNSAKADKVDEDNLEDNILKTNRNKKRKMSSVLDEKMQTKSVLNKQKRSKEKKRRLETGHDKKEEELDPLEYYEAVKAEKAKKKREKREKNIKTSEIQIPDEKYEDYEDMEEGAKRSITYEMSKNKGLTAKKKKGQSNPRVKHKKKYNKAIIKRKGQVREVVKEMSRYGGEATGIRSHLVHSVKIK